MEQLTLEQKKALALAQARVRAEQDAPSGPTETQRLASQYYHTGDQKNLSDLIAPDRFKTDVSELPWYTRAAGGAKHALDSVNLGLKGLLPQSVQDAGDAVDRYLGLGGLNQKVVDQGRAFVQQGGPAATVGQIGADVAMAAVPTGIVAKAVTKAPLLARTLAELGFNAGYSAATSPEDRATAAGAGALGTAVGMGANRLIGGAIKPFVSRDAQALADQGIQPTIGQAVGGFANTAEQKLKSLPLVGDVIRKARDRAVNEFNEKAIQTAVPGSKGFGDDALIAARETLSDNYKTLIPKGTNVTIDDSALINATIKAADDPALGLTEAAKKRVYDYVQKNVIDRSKNITGDTAKDIESDFGKFVLGLKSSSTQEERAIGDALSQVNNEWRRLLPDAIDKVAPGSGAALRDNDAAWRALVALDRAGAYRGNQNAATNEVTGRFTPNSLRRSIEASDQSQFNNVTRALRGGQTPFDKLNTLTRQGERVLGDSVPDSGTAGRAMMGLTAVGAGSAAGLNATDMAGGAALAFPLYSRGGSKFLMQGLQPAYEAAVKQLSLRGVPTQTIDEALRKYGPQGVISLARGVGVNSQ